LLPPNARFPTRKEAFSDRFGIAISRCSGAAVRRHIGTWIQFTALGYYVAKLAPNVGIGSFYIGLLGASRMIPVLIASPFAGVVADRYPRVQFC